MANGVSRLIWRTLGVADYAVAVPLYFLVPRHVRFRWSAPGTVLRNRRGFDEVMRLTDPDRRALVLDVGGGIAALKDLPDSGLRTWLVTLDIDMEMLRRARKKVPNAGMGRAFPSWMAPSTSSSWYTRSNTFRSRFVPRWWPRSSASAGAAS